MRSLFVVALFTGAACGNADKGTAPPRAGSIANTSPTAGPAAPPPATGVLELAPAAMTVEPGGTLTVDAAGKVTLNGQEVGVISATGELVGAAGPIAELDDDGRVTVVGWGPGLDLAVRADGAVVERGAVALAPGPGGDVPAPPPSRELEAMVPAFDRMKLTGDRRGYRALVFAWLAVTLSR